MTQVWRHNRTIYPGWLTVPSGRYLNVAFPTRTWSDQVLYSLNEVGPVERLMALRELTWRHEILLVPIRRQMESVIEETLTLIDCENRTVAGAEARDVRWEEIRDAWRNSAIALVTAARFRLDRSLFDERIKSLSPFMDEDAELRNHILYERCLWSIFDLQFDELQQQLHIWKTDNCDPAWMMRKAALLWETGLDREAEELLQNAISEIRAMPIAEHSLAAQSREAWAVVPAMRSDNRRASLDRLRELTSLRCDVFEDKQAVLDAMEPGHSDDAPPVFDINVQRGTGIRFTGYDPYTAAYRAVRHAELTGQPPTVKEDYILINVWAEVLRRAAQELSANDPELAVRLVLRACNDDSDNVLQRVLSRDRVANLDIGQADRLAQACLRAVDHRLELATYPSTLGSITAAIEVLSRLALRVSNENANLILDRAITYCQDQHLADGTGWRAVRNLLRRTWEALNAEDRGQRVFDLLNAPIAGLDGPSPLGRFEWPDPSEAIRLSNTLPDRTPENESQWQVCVDLLARGLRSSHFARRRACSRMLILVKSKNLRDDEIQRLTASLWEESLPVPGTLPGNTDLFDWAFLSFPEPQPGIAVERFREKWLAVENPVNADAYRSDDGVVSVSLGSAQSTFNDTYDLESRLWQVGSAIRCLQVEDKELDLSGVEKQHLLGLVETWADSRPPQHELLDMGPFGQIVNQRTSEVASVIPAIIEELSPTDGLGESLYAKLEDQISRQAPVFDLVPTLIRISPAQSTGVATALRLALTSADRAVASSAARGLHLWLQASSRHGATVPSPPDDLVQEIGIAIAARRQAGVDAALVTAQWIFSHGTQSHRDSILPFVKTGLSYMVTELNYDPAREVQFDVPLRRILCAQLAMAIAEDGHDSDADIAYWTSVATDDPFPDVRNAISR